MASYPSRQCDLTKSNNMVFLNLAMKLDSSLHPNIKGQLKEVELMNGLFAVLGLEELAPVGSCLDGSKVNTPTDYGDVDILLVPTKYVLNEQLFDYDHDYPAFLHVRGDSDHAKIFKNVKLVDGCHVPVMVLKQIHKDFFNLVTLFVYGKTSGVVPKKGGTFNTMKRSGVGFELAKLDVDNFDLNGFVGHQRKGVDKLRMIGKFIDSSLDAFIDLSSNQDRDKPMLRRKRKQVQKECSSTNMMISAAIKAVDIFTGKYKEEQSERTSPNSCSLNQDSIEEIEIDPEDGDVTIKYNNNLDIDEANVSDEDNDDTSANMPVTTESNYDDDDSEDQKVFLPKVSSADLVPAFKFGDWPRPAAEWKTRNRQWPSEEIVQKVLECGCHIVSKRPLFSDLNGDPANEDNSPESDKTNTFFRLSFSRCELLLAKSLTESQKYCWRVLKAYQKKYLCTEPKVLASYHWKNVVFWVSEETDPSFWTEDNVLFGVCKALDFMIKCLRERFIPVYFVRYENLIAGCKHEAIEEALATVILIRKNPIEYLQLFIESPPQSLPYRASRTELKTSLDNKQSNIEFVLDTMVNSVRDIPELAMDKDVFSRMLCKWLELLNLVKKGIERNKSSKYSLKLIGNVEKLVKKVLSQIDFEDDSIVDKTDTDDGDSIIKTVVETAGSLLSTTTGETSQSAHIQTLTETATAFCTDMSVDRNKIFGNLLSDITSTIDDHIKAKPSSGATFLHGASAFFETVNENVIKISENEPRPDVPSGIRSFLSKIGERLSPHNQSQEEYFDLD
ncbi:uncharacterized protein LOC128231527 isoform X1 [Mya arenaria]|uniref:uncharacterized protein LOC128231527 isoform X1 n=1 Tax=Mya arenaria TaxID=6604 RepID=UPI0022E5F8B0|nr:uncharacterized protein LOC128231527 isoform X1 [Mya arenaria]XP_052800449.1 uncharacterized protein LOC128231527 isoform X1 [Mya arenaria]XP_052800450.1 uncharacterized protein LOC128231527 isoform X1 [Mya arenaria]XP_052800451.1 uncharacterized protein LOC128231527 isoform X1 [Mya arenaria]XP_052800452.1 uncharacterized protein LOC128231527 isoform X1 [Mya arenaria]